MCVAMRSRNHRSWVMTTAQPGNSSSAFSRLDEGLDVEVVGRLVEQQQVAALLEREREVEAVALTAGEHAGLLLLVGALEAELRRRRRATGSRSCRPGCSRARRRRPPTASCSGRCRRGSGRRSEILTVSPTLSSPPSSGSRPTIVLNSVVLPTPFGPMMPTMPLRGSVKLRPSMRTRSSKPFCELLRLDHDAAEARARRDLDLLEVELARAVGLGRHLLVAREARLRLGLAALGVASAPTRARRRGAWRASRPSCPGPARRSCFFSR